MGERQLIKNKGNCVTHLKSVYVYVCMYLYMHTCEKQIEPETQYKKGLLYNQVNDTYTIENLQVNLL